jgi:hypothetical protein
MSDLDSPGNGVSYNKGKNSWSINVSNVDNSGREEAKVSRCFGMNA